MSSDSLTLDEICTKLDNLSLRMLQLIEEYIIVKKTIQDFIKDGSLHLAKSRYIMGNRCVSVLQLPSEDSNNIYASTTVLSKENGDSDGSLTLELNRLSLSDNSKKPESENLKQRNKNKNSAENDDKQEEKETNENNEEACTPQMQDPLKWFGVLVPQNMRQAQSNFNKAIEYIIQCANIQLEMNSVKDKYEIYLAKKESLSKTYGS